MISRPYSRAALGSGDDLVLGSVICHQRMGHRWAAADAGNWCTQRPGRCAAYNVEYRQAEHRKLRVGGVPLGRIRSGWLGPFDQSARRVDQPTN
jgi:hypothetical protein